MKIRRKRHRYRHIIPNIRIINITVGSIQHKLRRHHKRSSSLTRIQIIHRFPPGFRLVIYLNTDTHPVRNDQKRISALTTVCMTGHQRPVLIHSFSIIQIQRIRWLRITLMITSGCPGRITITIGTNAFVIRHLRIRKITGIRSIPGTHLIRRHRHRTGWYVRFNMYQLPDFQTAAAIVRQQLTVPNLIQHTDTGIPGGIQIINTLKIDQLFLLGDVHLRIVHPACFVRLRRKQRRDRTDLRFRIGTVRRYIPCRTGRNLKGLVIELLKNIRCLHIRVTDKNHITADLNILAHIRICISGTPRNRKHTAGFCKKEIPFGMRTFRIRRHRCVPKIIRRIRIRRYRISGQGHCFQIRCFQTHHNIFNLFNIRRELTDRLDVTNRKITNMLTNRTILITVVTIREHQVFYIELITIQCHMNQVRIRPVLFQHHRSTVITTVRFVGTTIERHIRLPARIAGNILTKRHHIPSKRTLMGRSGIHPIIPEKRLIQFFIRHILPVFRFRHPHIERDRPLRNLNPFQTLLRIIVQKTQRQRITLQTPVHVRSIISGTEHLTGSCVVVTKNIRKGIPGNRNVIFRHGTDHNIMRHRSFLGIVIPFHPDRKGRMQRKTIRRHLNLQTNRQGTRTGNRIASFRILKQPPSGQHLRCHRFIFVPGGTCRTVLIDIRHPMIQTPLHRF